MQGFLSEQPGGGERLTIAKEACKNASGRLDERRGLRASVIDTDEGNLTSRGHVDGRSEEDYGRARWHDRSRGLMLSRSSS